MHHAILDELVSTPRIAYFSMEIALESDIPTYSGGLGVLAGDMLRSAADLELPLVGVTLVSRAGYFRQTLDAHGRQSEHDDWWRPEQHAAALPAKIAIDLCGRPVWVGAWLHVIAGANGPGVPVLLLDTHQPENDERDRGITNHLYGGDAEYRLKQEAVLGLGGVQMLRALGFQVRRYHLNEGHAALLCLGLLRRTRWTERPGPHAQAPLYNLEEVRAACAFTTHTPVEAGHDKFPHALAERVLAAQIDIALLKELGGTEQLNLTQLALNLCGYVNGVANSHAVQSRRMFPGYRVHAISNGAHPSTWIAPSVAALYAHHFPGWELEPESLARIESVDDASLQAAHLTAKRALLELARGHSGRPWREDVMTLCFARRMTGYKRPELLFSDLERLHAIAASHPIQIIVAGKAHPHDREGKRLIEAIHHSLAQLAPTVPGVFLPGYSMDIARCMVAGADLWLNTPLPPLEASGTSGMKAALNGVPSLSVLDGWWLEGCIEGVTGWSIGTPDDSPEHHGEALLARLEQHILPLFYDSPPAWTQVMKGAIKHASLLFTSHRTVRRYAAEAYLRA